MKGKIKLKLNQKSSIKSNSYQIFIDNNFIGSINYKNPKIDFTTNLGNHKILVRGSDFENEQNFTLSSRKIVLPIEINENIFWIKNSRQVSKVLNIIITGFLLVYTFIFTSLVYTKQVEFIYPLLAPLFILLFTNFLSKNDQKFELVFK